MSSAAAKASEVEAHCAGWAAFLLFVLLHSPWALGVTFAIGIVWGWEFAVHRNLAGLILSHCILGTVSLFSGPI